MIGIVVCAHGNLANEMCSAALFITGGQGHLSPVAVDHNVEADHARGLVKDVIKMANDGHGVLVITDLYGGTPSNICLSLADEFKMEVLAGMNLPMLVKAVSLQKNSTDLIQMAKKLATYGSESILLASELLNRANAKAEPDSK